jgi:cob(I)alamin adenosyltransferase
VFDHVSKSDFQELRSEMVGVQFTLKRDHADSRLHSIEQELFNLTEHVSDDRSKGKVSDELYDRRIDDLQHQKEEVLRQMAVLDNQEKSP